MNASYKISQVTKLTQSTMLDCYYIVLQSLPNDADGFYYTLQNKADKPGVVMFVALDKGDVIRGFIIGHFTGTPGNAKIDWLFVEGRHGRQGVGGMLVQTLSDYCRAHDISQLHVQPARTIQARQFYAKHGFVPRDYVLWDKDLGR
ncbi:MAG: GNAT family N-acetyltransferase [Alphaproteobacteria bacterium]|nr:GNAT family N-acetyltransferase [Alphaproteobacteria bacterium]